MDRKKYRYLLFGALAMMLISAPARANRVKEQIEKPVRNAVRLEQQTQAGEAKWRQEKEEKLRQFETLENQIATLEKSLAAETDRNQALKASVAQKERQLADIQQISDQIAPFLDRLIAQLHELKESDLPFLDSERSKRLASLEALNRDPKAPVSEKYRKIMEALLVEAEYGRTVEVSQRTIDLAGEDTLVNIFRLGRLNLFYQTLDRARCGFYNPAQKTWAPLDPAFLKEIQAAVEMGAKRKPVALTDLPLGRIVVQ
ncbi:MAG: DUF3450 domain-containing protein [Desulfobacter sp.]|nr:MAG: DUF3450 domain-containing protein [Desulfobacter sp.]